jgi:hypothetical protein
VREIRALFWLVGGVVAVLIGVATGFAAAAAAAHAGSADEAPACGPGEIGGCTTERPALLVSRGHIRLSWLTGERKWIVDLPDGAPGRPQEGRDAVVLPRQAHRDGLTTGDTVTLVYLGRAAAWLRAPDGALLETEDHPRRSAPMLGWMTLAAIGGGVFAIRLGISGGRANGWLRKGPVPLRPGVAALATIAGGLGAIVQVGTGSTVLASVVAGGFTAAVISLMLRRRGAEAAD